MAPDDEITIEVLDSQITDLVLRVNRLEKLLKLSAEYTELDEMRRITGERLVKELYKFRRLIDPSLNREA